MDAAAWVFSGLLIVFLASIVGYREFVGTTHGVHRNTQMILGVLCALLAGFAAFFIAGSAIVNLNVDTGSAGKISVQATSGFGLFVLLMWWWRTFPPIPEASDQISREIVTQAEQIRETSLEGMVLPPYIFQK